MLEIVLLLVICFVVIVFFLLFAAFKLIEQGFEYVTEMGGIKLFRKCK